MKADNVGTGIVIAAFIVATIIVCPVIYMHCGKAYADADREIHQTSKSFVMGTAEHLQRLKLDYDKSDNPRHRESIRQMVLLEAANVDITKMQPHLQSWIKELRR